jgi:hypothetical protein
MRAAVAIENQIMAPIRVQNLREMIAEEAPPYVHPKITPRANGGDCDNEVTIKIVGGPPEL